jgi:hypothetical protein
MAIVSADLLGNLTRSFERGVVTDNIFTGNSLLFRMKEQAALRVTGGTDIRHQIVVNTGVGGPYGGGFDGLNTSEVDFTVSAQHEWRYYHEPIVVADTDLLQNSGSPERIVDLLKVKMEHASMALADTVGDGLWSDGTGNAGNNLDGLRAVLSTTSTYAGLAPGTYATWAASINGSTSALTLNVLDTEIMDATIGSDSPTDIVVNKGVFAKCQQLVRAAANASTAPMFGDQRAGSMADAGFRVIGYQGIPIYFDEKSPGSGSGTSDNYLSLLNFNYLNLVSHSDDDFKMDEWRKAQSQRAKVNFLFWTGNLECLQRRVQGAMTVIDPAL